MEDISIVAQTAGGYRLGGASGVAVNVLCTISQPCPSNSCSNSCSNLSRLRRSVQSVSPTCAGQGPQSRPPVPRAKYSQGALKGTCYLASKVAL